MDNIPLTEALPVHLISDGHYTPNLSDANTNYEEQ